MIDVAIMIDITIMIDVTIASIYPSLTESV